MFLQDDPILSTPQRNVFLYIHHYHDIINSTEINESATPPPQAMVARAATVETRLMQLLSSITNDRGELRPQWWLTWARYHDQRGRA